MIKEMGMEKNLILMENYINLHIRGIIFSSNIKKSNFYILLNYHELKFFY